LTSNVPCPKSKVSGRQPSPSYSRRREGRWTRRREGRWTLDIGHWTLRHPQQPQIGMSLRLASGVSKVYGSLFKA
ncbi:MAG: hypothetical protein ABR568_24140, partial [Pyrinomonadaceae bacterium]